MSSKSLYFCDIQSILTEAGWTASLLQRAGVAEARNYLLQVAGDEGWHGNNGGDLHPGHLASPRPGHGVSSHPIITARTSPFHNTSDGIRGRR